MYDFHCSYMKKKYGGNFKLLMTGIDSLMYEIEIETDFYKDTKDDISEKFDTSKFPENRLSGINRLNEKFLECWKMNVVTTSSKRFVVWGQICMLIKWMRDTRKKRKGVKKSVVQKGMIFDEYENCLFSQKV